MREFYGLPVVLLIAQDGGAIIRRSLDQCIEKIYQEKEGSRLMLLAPWMELKPSMLREELPRLAQKGFKSSFKW